MLPLLDALRKLPAEGLAPADDQLDEKQKRFSDHLVRLARVYFGVVVAQSLVLYREVVVSPFDQDHIAAALALASIYVMIVWSWIDWNTTMELGPYDFRPRSSTPVERFVEHSERWALETLASFGSRIFAWADTSTPLIAMYRSRVDYEVRGEAGDQLERPCGRRRGRFACPTIIGSWSRNGADRRRTANLLTQILAAGAFDQLLTTGQIRAVVFT